MSKNYCKVEHKWCKFCKKGSCGMCCTFCPNYVWTLKTVHKCPKRMMKETISLREIIKQVNFYDVMTAMLQSHPNEKKSVIGYAKLYCELQTLKGIKSDGMLRCTTSHWKEGDCIDIWGVYNNKEYAIEFIPWGEWLTMNIEETTLDNYTKEEIVASAFWEMTFNGFTQEKVNAVRERIEQNFEECEAKSKKK